MKPWEIRAWSTAPSAERRGSPGTPGLQFPQHMLLAVVLFLASREPGASPAPSHPADTSAQFPVLSVSLWPPIKHLVLGSIGETIKSQP